MTQTLIFYLNKAQIPPLDPLDRRVAVLDDCNMFEVLKQFQDGGIHTLYCDPLHQHAWRVVMPADADVKVEFINPLAWTPFQMEQARNRCRTSL